MGPTAREDLSIKGLQDQTLRQILPGLRTIRSQSRYIVLLLREPGIRYVPYWKIACGHWLPSIVSTIRLYETNFVGTSCLANPHIQYFISRLELKMYFDHIPSVNYLSRVIPWESRWLTATISSAGASPARRRRHIPSKV